MADDPLGLTPDPSQPDLKIPDYLGQESPLAFKGQPALPVTGAAAFGSPSGPNTQGGGPLGLSGGGATAPGGGSVDFATLARALFQGGGDAAKLLGGTGDLGTRGDTGGVSLSDHLRDLESGGANPLSAFPMGEPASQVSGGELALGAGEELAGAGAGQAAEEGLMSGLGGGGLDPFSAWAIMGLIKSLWDPDNAFKLPFSGEGRAAAQMHETGGIRKDFSGAFPILKGATGTESRFGGLAGLSKEDQIKELQGIAQEGGLQLDQIPAVSQFTSTQGGRQSGGKTSIHIDPLNVSGIEAQTPVLYMDALLNSIVANDRLAQLGAAPDASGTARNIISEQGPGHTLYLLAQEAGVDPNQFIPQQSTDNAAAGADLSGAAAFQMTPEESAGFTTPGQVIPTIQSIFTRLNPDFPNSPLGQRLAALGGAAPEAGAAATETTPATIATAMGTGGDFGDVAGAAMSGGGGGAEQAAEQLEAAA